MQKKIYCCLSKIRMSTTSLTFLQPCNTYHDCFCPNKKQSTPFNSSRCCFVSVLYMIYQATHRTYYKVSNYRAYHRATKCITGNVHIDYRCGDPTCGVARAMALCCRCASCRSLSLENAIYLASSGRAGPFLYGSNAVSCGSVGGVLTQD